MACHMGAEYNMDQGEPLIHSDEKLIEISLAFTFMLICSSVVIANVKRQKGDIIGFSCD